MNSTIKILAAATGFAIAASAGSSIALAQGDPAMIAPSAVAPVAAPAAVAQPVVQGAVPTYAAPAATGYGAPAYGAPAPMSGAVAGSTAADRDGDGIVDGYYTADGMYHPIMAPAPMPAPQLAYRRGERG